MPRKGTYMHKYEEQQGHEAAHVFSVLYAAMTSWRLTREKRQLRHKLHHACLVIVKGFAGCERVVEEGRNVDLITWNRTSCAILKKTLEADALQCLHSACAEPAHIT